MTSILILQIYICWYCVACQAMSYSFLLSIALNAQQLSKRGLPVFCDTCLFNSMEVFLKCFIAVWRWCIFFASSFSLWMTRYPTYKNTWMDTVNMVLCCSRVTALCCSDLSRFHSLLRDITFMEVLDIGAYVGWVGGRLVCNDEASGKQW